MAAGRVVFCEGKSDKVFLECVARQMKIDNLEMIPIQAGVSCLEEIAPQIKRRHDEGSLVALILDANSDPAGRRNELALRIADLALPVFRTFLLPNDQDSGCLETLLQCLAVDKHRVIHDCFTHYEQCLRDSGSSYKLPHVKGKVYAYCEALGIETQDWKRDYTDTQFWNLEAAEIEPLKLFLQGLASE